MSQQPVSPPLADALGRFAPLASKHDELRAMLRAREKALKNLAAVLRDPGFNHPDRRAIRRFHRRERARLRQLIGHLDATIAAFIAEHQREILG